MWRLKKEQIIGRKYENDHCIRITFNKKIHGIKFTYMSITEWIADSPESFGRYSDNHKNGCTQENTFDRMPKIGIGQPEPKWLYHVVFQIVISNTFVHNHHYNQPKIRQR